MSRVSYREAREKASGTEGRRDVSGKSRWSLDKNAPVGPMADFIVLSTDHPQLKTLRIPISGFVRPVMSVTPRIADFGRRELNKPQTASLEIRNLSSAAVDLGEVTSSIAGLDAEVEPLEEGRLYKVLLTLQPGMAKGDFEGLGDDQYRQLASADHRSQRQGCSSLAVLAVLPQRLRSSFAGVRRSDRRGF